MTDVTDTSESAATERSSTDEQSQATGRSSPAWPPSNYAILLAILFVGGAGIALVASDQSTADLLATVGYYILVAGVGLRVVEHAMGKRVRAAIDPFRRLVGDAGDALPGAASRALHRRGLNEETERGLRLTVPLTFAGGVALLVWWWLDTGAIPNRFLAGWLLTLGAIFGLYLLVKWYNQRERERQS